MNDRQRAARVEAARLALNENVDPGTFRQAAEGKPHAEEAIAKVVIAALDRSVPVVAVEDVRRAAVEDPDGIPWCRLCEGDAHRADCILEDAP